MSYLPCIRLFTSSYPLHIYCLLVVSRFHTHFGSIHQQAVGTRLKPRYAPFLRIEYMLGILSIQYCLLKCLVVKGYHRRA